jgi:hypothetical protein
LNQEGAIPLYHGRTAKGIKRSISKNIRTEIQHGRNPRQAVAIAYSVARKDRARLRSRNYRKK